MIEMLVAIGILGIVISGFISMMSYMRRELQAANRKVEAIELRRTATTYMSDLPTCGCQLNLNGGTFDATLVAPAVPEMNISKLQTGCAPTASSVLEENQTVPGSSANLAVESVKLQSIEATGSPNRYRGRLHIEFKSDSQTYSTRGFEFEIRFRTDPATPDTAKKVVACEFVGSSDGAGAAGGAGGGITGNCPPGQYMMGIQNGMVRCSAVAVNGATSNSNSGSWTLTTPGPGCEGTSCITGDYGVCEGTSCVTNGNYCNGVDCAACGPTPACDGTSCNASRATLCPQFGFPI